MANYDDFMKKLGLAQDPVMLENPQIKEVVREPAAQEELTPGPQTAEGLLSPFAVPREANYQAPSIKIPETDPEIARARAAQEQAILNKLSGLDTDYKKNMQDAEDRKFNSEIFAAIGNYLPGVVAGATAMNTKASVKPADMPKVVAADPTAGVQSKYKTDYENLLSQYKSFKDGNGLSDKDRLYASIAQAQLQQGAERINANKENTDRNAGIRVGGAILKDQKDNELSDKQVETQIDIDNTLDEIGKITKEAVKFKDLLGPNAASYQQAKEGRFGALVPGKINEDYVQFRSNSKALQGQYQKIISGLTLSDDERAELKSYVPNVEMPYEAFNANAKAFERRVREISKRTNKNIKEKQGKNVEGYGAKASEETKVVNGVTYKRVNGGWQKAK